MLGMVYVYGINYSFLVFDVSRYGVAQSFERRTYIQFLAHFPYGEVTVGTSLTQAVDNSHILIVGSHRHIVI